MKCTLSLITIILLVAVNSLVAGRGANTLQTFRDVVDQEILRVFAELGKNDTSDKGSISRLKAQICELWEELKTKGHAARAGLDTEWRAAFLSLQAIFERAQIVALRTRKIETANCFILTPRVAAALMLQKGKKFSQVFLGMPIAFAEIRREILEEYLMTGAKLYAIYASDVPKILMADKDHCEGFNNYQELVKKYPDNLIDCPWVNEPMNNFPLEKSGIWYILDDNPRAVITMHAYQMFQSQKLTKTSSWSISMGTHAENRLKELDDFLEGYSNAAGLSSRSLFADKGQSKSL